MRSTNSKEHRPQVPPSASHRSKPAPGPEIWTLEIDYDEGVPRSYRAVVARGPQKAERRFSGPDPAADFRAALLFARERAAVCLLSATCDYFVLESDAHAWALDPELGEIIVSAEEERASKTPKLLAHR